MNTTHLIILTVAGLIALTIICGTITTVATRNVPSDSTPRAEQPIRKKRQLPREAARMKTGTSVPHFGTKESDPTHANTD